MALQSGKFYLDSAGFTLLDSAEGIYNITTTPTATITLQHDSDYALAGARSGRYTYLNNPLNGGARDTGTGVSGGEKTASTNWDQVWEDKHGFPDHKTLAVGNNMVAVRRNGAVDMYTINGDLVKTIYARKGSFTDNPQTAFAAVNDYDWGKGVAIGCGRFLICAPYDNGGGGMVVLNLLNGYPISNIPYGTNWNIYDGDTRWWRGGPFSDRGITKTGFGLSCAIGENRVIVGAPFDHKMPLSNYSDASQITYDGVGAIHIYDLEMNNIRTVPNPDPSGESDPGDHFGMAVAIGDGRIVVGAPNYNTNGVDPKGAIFILDLDGSLIKKIINPISGDTGGNFGNSVAVGSGRVVVGNYMSSSVYAYDLNGNLIASESYPGTYRGFSVAVGDGRILSSSKYENADSSAENGSVRVFDTNLNLITTIQPPGDIVDSDRFGETIAMDNGIIAISAPGKDTAGSTDAGKIYLYSTPKQPSAIFWNKGFEHHADSI